MTLQKESSIKGKCPLLFQKKEESAWCGFFVFLFFSARSIEIVFLGIFPEADLFLSFFFLRVNEMILNAFIYLFIYFWLRWVFIGACGLSLVAASVGYSSL